jgi:Chaperone of endosialidase
MKRAIKIETASFPTRSHCWQVLFTLGVVAFCQAAHAVAPAPDGGYAGGNTAEGQNALFSLTTGTYNTAVGFLSLESDIAGQFNTAIGAGALLANVGDPSTGAGTENTATGAGALLSNTNALDNTADGAFALFSNTRGSGNTATGAAALERNTTGAGNTAIGQAALNENVTGSFNTAIGTAALLVASGDSNTVVGSGAGGNVGGANHVICIGQGVAGANVDNSCYIGSIWNQPGGSQPVYVNSDGKLGLLVSSRRFKDEIKPIGTASAVIYALEPVSFRYKPEIEPTRPRAFGLIAEDVEKISPDLVTRGVDGKVNSVRYDQVNAMLLNEFLKAHRKIEEQQKQIEGLTTQLKEQANQLQKVSVQVGLNRPVHRMALNNP